ncbi:hypothetical protein BT69DRAFT_1328526 [Atractiella rhizophila]|nr:hypothetical protein BT69DRAFT_1328526 [Atractiella rhizophila]
MTAAKKWTWGILDLISMIEPFSTSLHALQFHISLSMCLSDTVLRTSFAKTSSVSEVTQYYGLELRASSHSHKKKSFSTFLCSRSQHLTLGRSPNHLHSYDLSTNDNAPVLLPPRIRLAFQPKPTFGKSPETSRLQDLPLLEEEYAEKEASQGSSIVAADGEQPGGPEIGSSAACTGTSNKNTQVTALCGGTSVESVNLSTCTAIVSTTSLSTPTSGKTRKSGVVSTVLSTTSKSMGKRTRGKYSRKSVLEIRAELEAHGPASDESDEE